MTQLLIIEDHASVAEAIQLAIEASDDEIDCVGIASTIQQAMQLFASEEPDTILMDVELPDGDGIDATRRLKAIDPSVRIVVLTAHISFDVLVAAADAGADVVLPKEASITELADALHGPLQTATVGPVTEVRSHNGRDPQVALTPRELEVLELLSDGLPAKAIAAALDISVHTTRGHIKNLLWKLGEHSQLGAVAAGNRLGLLDHPVGRRA